MMQNIYKSGLKSLLICTTVLLVFSSSCRNTDEVNYTDWLDSELQSTLNEASNGAGMSYFRMPDSDDLGAIPQDPKNSLSREKVELGKLLYHETGLALNPKHTISIGTYSCATCHSAKAGFQACLPQGVADGGIGFGLRGEGRTKSDIYMASELDVQPIRTPSAMNIAYQRNILWNGQFGATAANVGTESQWTPDTPKEVNTLGYEGLEIQAIAGLEVHRLQIEDNDLITDTDYKPLFDYAFSNVPVSERYTQEYAGLAIAAYERTLLANQSPFQMWLRGDAKAMSEQEKEGALLFFGKAGCNSCHTGPALSSETFQAIGMRDLSGSGVFNVTLGDDAHKGRGGFTQQSEDMFKFKVPQLYNLMDSPFYGHGASFTNIRDVVEYKNEGKRENYIVPESQLSDEFHPLGLTANEVDQITAFLETALNDPNLQRYEPDALISGNCFPNNDALSKIDIGCE